MSGENGVYRELKFTVRDGLRLYGRHYPARVPSSRRPVLCLAGLTRNSRDFGRIATALSQHASSPRDVYTLDTRGRGFFRVRHRLEELFGADRDARRHRLHDHDGTQRSRHHRHLARRPHHAGARGGAARPHRRGGAERYRPRDRDPGFDAHCRLRRQDAAAEVLARGGPRRARPRRSAIFPNSTKPDAEAFARQLFNEKNGKPAPGYDNKLSRCLSVLDGPMPQLWPQFEALKRVPVLVVRGENSDLLSEATVAEMAKRHPNLTSVTAAKQGHAPLLVGHGDDHGDRSIFAPRPTAPRAIAPLAAA